MHKAKRVVVTSSTMAVIKKYNGQLDFSNKDWSDSTKTPDYEKSKTLAEKAAWDFVDALPEDEKFELVTINPGLVLGPNLT